MSFTDDHRETTGDIREDLRREGRIFSASHGPYKFLEIMKPILQKRGAGRITDIPVDEVYSALAEFREAAEKAVK